MERLIEYDKELFLWLNNLGSETWDPFWLMITDKWGSIPFYVLILYLVIRKFGVKHTLLILVFVALIITVSDQLSNIFKYGVARLRPCYDETVYQSMRLVKKTCGGKFGYFSAHAANSFTLITFISLLLQKYYKWIPYTLLIWALLVAYSRIYIGVHFPLDIISGMSVGMLIGFIFFKIYKYVNLFFFRNRNV